MLPMMAFGMTAAGLVMAPMGFQFLAVLAGKALLLSKMALLLAVVNGLKKVASSGVHYGLYHSNSHHAHPLWDRGDTERPRSQ
ncbi:hypothetical protein HA402_008698 [Bradysia odoriphaga]|nr:hypothetical protein HA402_008698 [Bradysia odoriphaga]